MFRSIDDANLAISKAIATYNTVRPHMSIDYMTPQEARECTGPLKKRWRSYREEAIQKAQKDKDSKELVTS
ncbi:integrase core domain-containing protein [Porphyromonas asaccharolytica]|uniref:integrase core domain-containing protein n=1 Tax=Porphyromonas asaccharolytica TaxID=28123 RepID=UPI003CD0CC85